MQSFGRRIYIFKKLMDLARPENPTLVTLQQTALKLGVSIDVLFTWNEHNILKPTITPDGQVGYKQEQIEQFLAIQHMLRQPENSPTPQVNTFARSTFALQQPAITEGAYIDFAKEIFTSKVKNQEKKKTYKGISPVLFLSSCAVLFVLLIIAGIVTQEKMLVANNQSSQKILGDQTSTFEFTKPIANPTQTEVKNTTPHDKNLNIEGESILASALSSVLFEKKTPSHVSKNSASNTAQLAIEPEATNGKFTNTGTVFASVSNTKNNTPADSSIDANGNISGKTNSIAALLGNTNISENGHSVAGATDITSQVLLIIFGLGTFFFIIRKPKKSVVSAIPTASISPKVLEIDQRMDGTVVLHFQGNVYKISKPELNSDSDQFIERLMELVQPDRKEIEYDSMQDAEVKLTTPLSRIVTRLGFVGIKRDLFFPRTSKNTVLFRKYITQKDLSAMGLTTEQIIADLTQTS